LVTKFAIKILREAFANGVHARAIHASNGRKNPANPHGGPNGPGCGGLAVGSRRVELKAGDVLIVPPGVIHGTCGGLLPTDATTGRSESRSFIASNPCVRGRRYTQQSPPVRASGSKPDATSDDNCSLPSRSVKNADANVTIDDL
jgi:hypothetical protein